MRALLLSVLALELAACGPSVAADSGRDARLQVAGGTFSRGAFPEPRGGPAVLAAYLGRVDLRRGEQDKSFSGVLEAGATAAAIALDGDAGFWTVPAGFPLPESPESPSFSAPLSFSRDVAIGPARLLVWAANQRGDFGDALPVKFRFVPAPVPEGELVVALTWDPASDLDLHVVDANGVEIDKDDMIAGAGRLDVDSNAECAIDGRNNENAIWKSGPPQGRYLVRVDPFSLCGAPIARWRVDVWLRGELVTAAEGTSTLAGTRQRHGHGAGVLALEFDVP